MYELTLIHYHVTHIIYVLVTRIRFKRGARLVFVSLHFLLHWQVTHADTRSVRHTDVGCPYICGTSLRQATFCRIATICLPSRPAISCLLDDMIEEWVGYNLGDSENEVCGKKGDFWLTSWLMRLINLIGDFCIFNLKEKLAVFLIWWLSIKTF